MFTKCLNPDCGIPFDYREGQLVRFRVSLMNGPSAANQPLVEHFWLCGRCSKLYVLRQESGNLRMKLRIEELPAGRARNLVEVA